jgi:hypothetical protein
MNPNSPTPHQHATAPWRRRLGHALCALGAALTLTLVFSLYERPGFIVDLAGRMWSCI